MSDTVDELIARIDRRLTEAGLMQFAVPANEHERARIWFTEIFAFVTSIVDDREREQLALIRGNFEGCSVELLERASVMLAQAAIGKPIAAPEPDRIADLERRLERAEAMIQALTGPAVYQTPLAFRSVAGTATRPTTSTGDDEP